MTKILIFRECPVCLKPSSVFVPFDALERYRNGALIQDAMHMLTDDEREIFMTGIHEQCWPKALGITQAEIETAYGFDDDEPFC